ncbi:hypothetical protein AC578_11076 [Pseudocercospora eumusae]|uniref:Alpha/beta hydrolase fold-3 domain-containing protein n=1 Tax=Pseudocercospora eumusae TaxID=321146 RepID=A0A139HSJ1_9PEZI|nr:hypothetical protein AC578_11076 [Pseudocercospora eumusae]
MASEPDLEPNQELELKNTVVSLSYRAPGRIADPNFKFFQEPRAHPKLVEAFRAFGFDGSQPDPFSQIRWDDPASRSQMAWSEATTTKLYNTMPNDLPEDEDEPEIDQETRTFTSFDGVERKLYIFRPANQDRPLPCVVYFHGGGMVIMDTANKVHFRWCMSLAAQGIVAIAVDFRNAYSRGKHNPFPIGLKDCASAVRHIASNRSSFKVEKVALQGEDGGGNLALATALMSKKEGWVGELAGIYAYSPCISNGYGWSDARKLKELPSLYECEGYWLYTTMLAGMGFYYSGEDIRNPLAWPYHASIEDCVGLPPHVLAMDELDPLRDEGMAYHRKLLAAGVEANAQVNLGVVHAAALMFRKLIPESHLKVTRDVAAFVKSL